METYPKEPLNLVHCHILQKPKCFYLKKYLTRLRGDLKDHGNVICAMTLLFSQPKQIWNNITRQFTKLLMEGLVVQYKIVPQDLENWGTFFC